MSDVPSPATTSGLFGPTGVSIGHVSHNNTGVTVLYCGSQGAVASIDVRGGGPGTRETDLLEPHNTVERVHAITLAGGSAFGLAAADGVMRELESQGIGFPVLGEGKPGPRVPIVPGAVIFDLLLGDERPTAEDGAEAVKRAVAKHDASTGTVGAGVGATAGKMRGGFGLAELPVETLQGTFAVGAVVVANPVGSVVDPRTGRLFGAPDEQAVNLERFAVLRHPAESKLNTTIGAVLCDAPLTKAQAKRLALTGHDGIARAIHPAHSPLDGDTLFALSTASDTATRGVDTLTMAALCQAAAEAVEQAIVAAIVKAKPGLGLETYSSLLD